MIFCLSGIEAEASSLAVNKLFTPVKSVSG